jgi:hypothetical protein
MPTANRVQSVTIELASGEKKTVAFDLALFERVELITLLSTGELLVTLGEMTGATDAQGKPDARTILRKFRLATVLGFVAGCLGTSVAELSERMPLTRLIPAFNQLAAGFAAAAGEVYSAGEPAEKPAGEAPPQEAPPR